MKYFLLLLVVLFSVPWAQASGRCVMDDSDRQVCLQKNKPSIVSLSPGTTELLFAAGAGQQVVAVDEHSDYPPQVKQLPKVGGFPNISVEAIIAQKPDLVVVWQGGNSMALIQQLEKLGLKTVHIGPVTLPAIEQAIRKLGRLAGTESYADQSADRFSRRLAKLHRQYSDLPPLSVFFELWQEPLMSVGNQQIMTQAIKVCGGQSIFADVAEQTMNVSSEQLVARNPQVIMAAAPLGDTPDTRQKMQVYWQQWSELSAVKRRQFIILPSDLITRPTPRMLEGTEVLCQQLQAFRERKTRPESSPGTSQTSN